METLLALVLHLLMELALSRRSRDSSPVWIEERCCSFARNFCSSALSPSLRREREEDSKFSMVLVMHCAMSGCERSRSRLKRIWVASEGIRTSNVWAAQSAQVFRRTCCRAANELSRTDPQPAGCQSPGFMAANNE